MAGARAATAAAPAATKGTAYPRQKPATMPAATASTLTPTPASVSRYSNSASWHLKAGAATPGRNTLSKPINPGNVARFSGTRVGARGAAATMPGRIVRSARGGGRGAVTWPQGGGGAGRGANFGWRHQPLGWPGWPRGRGWGHAVGRVGGGRGGRGGAGAFGYPGARTPRWRYNPRMQAAAAAAATVAARFRHPAASRWAGYRAPPSWAGRAAWGRQGRGGRSRRPVGNGRCKNRSLIRVRSLIMPQPTAAGAAAAAAAAAKRAASLSGAAAAAVAAAVARRASFGLTRSALALRVKAGAAAPASFVRSGKHGMAIRRVNSSDLAARRAAAAAAAAAAPGARRSPASAATSTAIVAAKGGKTRAGKLPPGPPAKGKAVVVSKGTASAAPASAAAVSKAAASKAAALLVRKAALLSKARMRSGASRKAAAVVAGARVKRARVLMRNMTLYRGKGVAGVVAGGVVGTGGGQAVEQDKEKKQKEAYMMKKARVKAEPCLFFCKFGKCSKSDEDCRFAHDKAKVAVCRAFLRGACEKKEKCLLTHAVQAEKMPVCIYFEKGLCFTPNCPYLHVKVSRNAAVCAKFLKGYCPDGAACRLKHELPDHRKRARDAASAGGGEGDEQGSSNKKTKMMAPETGSNTRRRRKNGKSCCGREMYTPGVRSTPPFLPHRIAPHRTAPRRDPQWRRR
ncbi:unnamed protein product [Laminaria digitata]